MKGARVTSFVHATTSIISLWRSLTFPKVPRTRKPRTRIPNPSWDAGEDAGRCRWHRGPFDGPRAPGPAPPFSAMWPWASLHLLSTLVSHLESGLTTVLTTAGQSLGWGRGGGGGRVQSRSARGARGTWETMKVHISSHDGGERKGALGRPRLGPALMPQVISLPGASVPPFATQEDVGPGFSKEAANREQRSGLS